MTESESIPEISPAVEPVESLQDRVYQWVERVGNKLPHPFTLFLSLAIGVLFASAFFSWLGASVTYDVHGPTGVVSKTIAVQNLLGREYLRDQLRQLVSIYVGFPPLGLAMIMILGVGLLEQSGLISAVIRKTVLGAPASLVTASLAFVGVNANLASGAGVIFMPIIGGALFKAAGRHPYLGIAVGYAAASGGFAANLIVAGTDALLSGITASAAKSMAIEAPVHPAINWYFMIASTFVITALVTFVAERYLAPRFAGSVEVDAEALKEHAVTEEENRGLRFALAALVIVLSLIAMGIVPPTGFLRGEDGSFIPKSPLLEGVVALLFFGFCTVGVAFGVGARTITSERDIPKMMEGGLRGALAFLVVALPASFFIHFFSDSKLAVVLAVKGAQLLKQMQISGVFLLVLLALFTALLNLVLPSGSSKWLILAPIFVPMFATVGHSPAATQMAFRIGDCATNVISPFKSYLPVLLGLLAQYGDEQGEEAGIGTLIALELPFSIALLIGLPLLLVVWVTLGIPLGPGVSASM